MKNKLKGNLLLLFTAFIWGFSYVAQVSGGEELGVFTFNFMRNLVAGLALFLLLKAWPWLMKKPMEEDSPAKKKNTFLGGLVCGLALTVAMAFQQLGLTGPQATTAGKAGFITALYIILVPLTGIFIGKRLNLRIWFCVLLATLGLYLLSIQSGLTIQWGDLMILLSAIFYTLHILVIDYFSPQANGVKLSMIQFLTAALLSGLVMVLREQIVWSQVRASGLAILYAGMVSSGIGYTLQIIAQRDTDPTIASLLMSLESVFAVLAGALLLGERLTLREGLGCVLMMIAIILAQLPYPFPTRKKQMQKEFR